MTHNHFLLLYSLPWLYLLFDSQLRDTAFDRCTPCFRVFTTLLFYLFLSFGSPSASPSALYLHSTTSLRRPRPSIRLGSMRRPALLFDQPYESSDLKPSARAAPWSEREPCRRLPAFSCVHSIVRVGSLRGVTCNNHQYLLRFIRRKYTRYRYRYGGNVWADEWLNVLLKIIKRSGKLKFFSVKKFV